LDLIERKEQKLSPHTILFHSYPSYRLGSDIKLVKGWVFHNQDMNSASLDIIDLSVQWQTPLRDNAKSAMRVSCTFLIAIVTVIYFKLSHQKGSNKTSETSSLNETSFPLFWCSH
jgi:hypothetical protein